MSKRNNRKKGKQQFTLEQLETMIKEWQISNDDNRAVVFFTLSEGGYYSVSTYGVRSNMKALVHKVIFPDLMRRYGNPRHPSLWQRIRDRFFPFFKI